MNQHLIFLLACLTTQIVLGEPSLAEKNAAENAALKKEWESWNAPFKPVRLIGNIHYVGPSGISSFLVTTPEGHILLDTGFETTVPRIRDSVTKLGFRLADIKIILNSHAHSRRPCVDAGIDQRAHPDERGRRRVAGQRRHE